MNGQYQKTLAIRMSIPEDRKQHIIVLLGQMIDHSLTEAGNREELPARKGLEHPVMLKRKAVQQKSASCLEADG